MVAIPGPSRWPFRKTTMHACMYYTSVLTVFRNWEIMGTVQPFQIVWH